MRLLLLFIAGVLVVSGCTTYDTPTATPSQTPSAPVLVTPASASPTPTPTATQTSPSPTLTKETPTKENVTIFSVLATDYKFEPNSLQVMKGDRVRIVFTFNDSEIYFAGLDIKSNYFTVEYKPAQGNKTVEFTADQTFDFRSYWPSSGVLKAVGKVTISEPSVTG